MVLSAITTRVTMMLVLERGPLGISARMRLFFSEMDNIVSREFSALLSCVWCMSFWIGLLVTLLFHEPFYVAFFYSLIAMLVDAYVD